MVRLTILLAITFFIHSAGIGGERLIQDKAPLRKASSMAFNWLKSSELDSLQSYWQAVSNDNGTEEYDLAIIDLLVQAISDATYTEIADDILDRYSFDSYHQELLCYELYIGTTKLFKRTDLYHKLHNCLYEIAKRYKMYDEAYNALASRSTLAMIYKDFDTMEEVIGKMFASPMAKDSMLLSKIYLQVGLLNDSDQRDSTIYYLKKAYKLGIRYIDSQDDSLVVAVMLRALGKKQMQEGKLVEAIGHQIKSQRLTPEGERFAFNRVENYYMLSHLYLDLFNLEKAEEYANKALQLAKDKGFKMYKNARCQDLLGDISRVRKQNDTTLIRYMKAYDFYKNNWLNKQDPKITCVKIALLYGENNDLLNQKMWLDSAQQFVAESKMIDYLLKYNDGVIVEKSGDYTGALSTYKDLLVMAENLNSPSKINEVNRKLYEVNKLANNSTESLKYLEAYTETEKRIYRSGQEAAISELNANFRLDIKDQQIINLNGRNELTQTRVEAQRKLIIIGMVTLLILSALLFALYRMYKRSEEQKAQIVKADEEKKILLKEIHHRVKNNLQVISSLLKLQSKYIKDDNAIKAIAEGRTRVQSMALLHQNLYRDDNLKGVNMNEYFNNLIQGLFDAYNIEEDRISLNTQIEDLSLDVDTVIPLGLITNELISNALKHAFKNDAKGSIRVSLRQVEDCLELIVKDDGVGKTNDNEEKISSGFGQMLINSLSNKLDAEIFEKQDNGTEIKVIMKDFDIAA